MTYEYHTPVLIDAVLDYLQIHRAGIYVDGTLGGGGHTECILAAGSPQSRVIGFDRDGDALRHAKEHLKKYSDRVVFIHDNFASIRKRLQELSIDTVIGIVLDLGVSSHQIDETNRGFSFQQSHRLDMRMNREQKLDAWHVVNGYDQQLLADIFWRYGEERHSRRIAKALVEERKGQSIATTDQLAHVVRKVVGQRFLQKSLARIFQAIRIEVNDELESLRTGLDDSIGCLEAGGRIVVISYHSLEDRIVKECFKKESSGVVTSGSKFMPDRPVQPSIKILTKKPIVTGEEEVASNPRSRSAKLRAAEKII